MRYTYEHKEWAAISPDSVIIPYAEIAHPRPGSPKHSREFCELCEFFQQRAEQPKQEGD